MQYQPTHHIFREAQNYEEFEAMLRLRFEVFFEKGEAALNELSPTQEQFDVDQYDINAYHFGLFEVANGKERLIGGVRVIGNSKNTKSEEWLTCLLSQHPNLPKSLLDVPTIPFYLEELKNHQNKNSLEAVFQYLKKQASPVFEVSRLALHKSERQLNLGLKIIECAYAFVISQNSCGVFGIDVRSKPLFQRYFNYPLGFNSEFDFNQTKKTLVYVSIETLPTSKRAEFQTHASALLNLKKIRINLEKTAGTAAS